ncbi:MAG: hypothetical protein V7K62_24435 [Nostoc sp.]
MLVKDDYSKFIYSIDVNNSVEYFCESACTVSDRLSCALVTTAPLQPAIVPRRSRHRYICNHLHIFPARGKIVVTLDPTHASIAEFPV